MSLVKMAKTVFKESMFFTHDDCPFEGFVFEEDPDILVVVGENAAGKSLFFQFLASWVKKHFNWLGVTISIRERTGSGYHESSSFRKALMFGQEDEQSTGATSVDVVKSGFKNAVRDTDTTLMLDEPELGLSDGYTAALGAFIAQKHKECKEASDKYKGVVIVTHSRKLVRNLVTELGFNPSFVNMGSNKDLQSWLDSEETKSVEDLLNLSSLGRKKQTIASKIFQDLKK